MDSYNKLNDESKLVIDRLRIVQFGKVIVSVPENPPTTMSLKQCAFARIKCEFPGTQDKPFIYTTRINQNTLRKKLIRHFGASPNVVRAKYVNNEIKAFFDKAHALTINTINNFDLAELQARLSTRMANKIKRERKETHDTAIKIIKATLKTGGKYITEEEIVELWRLAQIDTVMST